MLLHSINPATGETLRSFTALTEEALHERIGLAAEAAKAAAEGELRAALAQVAASSQQLESLQGVADQLRKECRAAKAEVTHCNWGLCMM